MPHADDGRLHAWLDGALAPGGEEAERLRAHLTVCADCRRRLEEAREARAAAGDILGHAAPRIQAPPFERVRQEAESRSEGIVPLPGRRRPPGLLPLTWAATVVLALGMGWFLRPALTGPGETGADAPGAAPVRQSRQSEESPRREVAESGADDAALDHAAAPEEPRRQVLRSSDEAVEGDTPAGRAEAEAAAAPPPALGAAAVATGPRGCWVLVEPAPEGADGEGVPATLRLEAEGVSADADRRPAAPAAEVRWTVRGDTIVVPGTDGSPVIRLRPDGVDALAGSAGTDPGHPVRYERAPCAAAGP